MYNLGYYLVVVFGDGIVYCEVYWINLFIMNELDELKSNIKDYWCELIQMFYGSVWIYFYCLLVEGLLWIYSGDWFKCYEENDKL